MSSFCPEVVFGSSSAAAYALTAASLVAVRARSCALAIIPSRTSESPSLSFASSIAASIWILQGKSCVIVLSQPAATTPG
jgi:hypothetical protein